MKQNSCYSVSLMSSKNVFALHKRAGRRLFFTLLTIFTSWMIFAGALAGLRQDRLVLPVADRVLRFRILPEDDSTKAQKEKLRVRDEVLAQLAAALPVDADRDDVAHYIRTHADELSGTVKNVLSEGSSGSERDFSLSLTDCWFPEKTYGSLFFPQGTYHALLIRIGRASGRNWWCCLYPQLCYRDAVTAVVAPESEAELRAVLPEEDSAISDSNQNIKISFFLLEWLSEVFHS